MPTPAPHLSWLVTQFRRWFEEIKIQISSVESSYHVETTNKLNGMTKGQMVQVVGGALAQHMAKTNPHKDSPLYLDIISKEEWQEIKEGLVTLEEVPVAIIPKVVASSNGTAVVIEPFSIMYRGSYYDVPGATIAHATGRGTFSLMVVVTPIPGDKPTFHLGMSSGVHPGDHYRLSFGKVWRDATTGPWTVETEATSYMGPTSVGSTPTGNRVPVTTGIPAGAVKLSSTWR